MGKVRVGLVNDTSNEAHYGCVLTCTILKKLLSTYFDLKFSVQNDVDISKMVEEIDAIIINGEGTYHDETIRTKRLYTKASFAKKAGKQVYLINSVAQNIPVDYSWSVFDYITVREPLSYNYIRTQANPERIECIPDACFLQKVSKVASNKKGIIVTDDVIELYTDELAVLKDLVGGEFLSMRLSDDYDLSQIEIDNFLSKIAKAELVITGRYHGVVFSLMAGTPVLGLRSNTWKVEGLLKYFKRDNWSFNSILSLYDFYVSGKAKDMVPPSIPVEDIENQYKKLMERIINDNA